MGELNAVHRAGEPNIREDQRDFAAAFAQDDKRGLRAVAPHHPQFGLFENGLCQRSHIRIILDNESDRTSSTDNIGTRATDPSYEAGQMFGNPFRNQRVVCARECLADLVERQTRQKRIEAASLTFSGVGSVVLRLCRISHAHPLMPQICR